MYYQEAVGRGPSARYGRTLRYSAHIQLLNLTRREVLRLLYA